MGYQFIHVEGYARVGSVQKKTNPNTGEVKESKTKSVSEIMAEAERLEGNTPHIEKPQPPKLLYGCMPLEVIPIVDNWAENTKDAKGRKYRKDGLCLLAGVVSLPREYEDNFDKFAEITLEWLKEKYGDRLKSVVSHEKDEAHPHLHFYVVPEIGEKFDDIHEGYKAAHEAKAKNYIKGVQNQVYKAAMREFQDEFSKNVGVQMGLTRLGPGRRRLTREAWVNEKKQARFFADTKAVASSGWKRGFKKGKEKAKAETKEIVEIARKKAEEFTRLGGKVGALVARVVSSWHKPTAEALRVKEEAEARAKKVEAEAKTHVEAEKKKADNRVTVVANQLQQEKAKTHSLEQYLDKLEEKSKDLAEKVALYESKFGTEKTIKPK